MLNKLLANKKLFALIIAVIVIILGIAVIVGLKQGSGESGKSGVNIEKEDEKDDISKEEDVYDGNGLELKDEIDETVDSVDVSGDWDKPSDDSDKKEQSDKTDKTDKEDSDTNNNEDNKNDENGSGDEESDEDILIDDKVWGEPT